MITRAIQAPLQQDNHQPIISTQILRTGWENWLNALKLVKFLDEEDPECW